jgi:CRP-like cAMP-binding protein
MAGEYQSELAELVTDIGRRTAAERISHFFLNMMEWTGSAVADNKCIMRIPHRQEDIADLLGLTTTHVNRVISGMRKQKLISVRDDIVSILDIAALRASIR